MAKSRNQWSGIHSPGMVKTVFIVSSLAILAFLVLIVKTTSFKSEPRAYDDRDQCRLAFSRLYDSKKALDKEKNKKLNESYDNIMIRTDNFSCPGNYHKVIMGVTANSTACCIANYVYDFYTKRFPKSGAIMLAKGKVNYSVTKCGRVNCLKKYPGVANLVCGTADQTERTGFRCAINVKFNPYCSNGNASIPTKGGSYNICFL